MFAHLKRLHANTLTHNHYHYTIAALGIVIQMIAE